jgi:hypothetical protein
MQELAIERPGLREADPAVLPHVLSGQAHASVERRRLQQRLVFRRLQKGRYL